MSLRCCGKCSIISYMRSSDKKKSGLAAVYMLAPLRHSLLILSVLLILLHLAFRGNYTVMSAVSDGIARPYHRFMARLCSYVPFSVAEMLIALLVSGILVYIICAIVRLIRHEHKGRTVYITLVTLALVPTFIYALFCLLWGSYYYSDDFAAKSGLSDEAISVDDLETVTRYFAQMLNDSANEVSRDENGVYSADRSEILARSAELYRGIEEDFPCLAGDELRVKGIICSRVMSYVDFTGFFFPFTGEANVNMDSPASLLPSTVGHEIAHQRGVAKEQEANFVAVLVSLHSGDADYRYSACLLAYIHLGNALHGADYEAWREIYDSLDERVVADLRLNNSYWQQFETPVQQVSNTVYEGFLHSYDQTLGLKSYGACVDLLVNYYIEAAKDFLGELGN